jgi:hypothetical protein
MFRSRVGMRLMNSQITLFLLSPTLLPFPTSVLPSSLFPLLIPFLPLYPPSLFLLPFPCLPLFPSPLLPLLLLPRPLLPLLLISLSLSLLGQSLRLIFSGPLLQKFSLPLSLQLLVPLEAGLDPVLLSSLFSQLLFLHLQELGGDSPYTLLGRHQKIPQLLHEESGILSIQETSDVHLKLFWVRELVSFK